MKKILIGLALAVAAMAALAEPTFDQMQTMIGQKQYSSAAAGLEVIIQNHPQSAKAFYAMAQAQAGLGDLAKAKRALDKARGLDPELKFASEANVKALEQAITPQMAKIEVIEPSHFWRNLILVLIAALAGAAFYFYRKKDKPADTPYGGLGNVPPKPWPGPAAPEVDSPSDTAYMQEHNLVDTPAATPAPAKRGRPLKSSYSSVKPVAPVQSYTPPPAQPTIINNHYGATNSGGGDLLTGVLIGEALSNNHHGHRDTYVEREVIVERPVYRDTTPTYEAPKRSSTWDDTPAPSTKSSSWDDTPAKSSSWDDSSSSSSSSSDSWSSSSDSSSSSSSDSGSSDW